ncbi:MAG: LacI family transcriptional regulator, partial [Candidimonas sp.]
AVLDQYDKRVLLTTTQYDSSKEMPFIEILLHQKVDGLLLTVANARNCPALARLAEEKVPYVLMYNHAPGHATVSVDDRAAARDAVRHLIRAGHRRIAMLAGYLTASDRSALRHLGYRDAMAHAGLAPLPLAEVDFGAHSLDTHLHQWFDGPANPPSAIFCSTDMLALGVIKSLRQRALRTPDDVSVIGFDGLEYGQLIEPTLATISQPNEAIGREAANRLLADFGGGPAATQSLVLPHRLLAGGTVGPAPQEPQ